MPGSPDLPPQLSRLREPVDGPGHDPARRGVPFTPQGGLLFMGDRAGQGHE